MMASRRSRARARNRPRLLRRVLWGAAVAAALGLALFPTREYEHVRASVWVPVGIAVVTLAGAFGGAFYHAANAWLREHPVLARVLGVVGYLVVTVAAFIAVLNGPD